MNRLRLKIEDKKEIVIDELKRRSPGLKMESISSFVERLRLEYGYKNGSDRYFWKAIKELEEEGKIRRYRYGKRKIIILVKGKKERKELKQYIFPIKKLAAAKQLEITKDFISSWEYYDFIA